MFCSSFVSKFVLVTMIVLCRIMCIVCWVNVPVDRRDDGREGLFFFFSLRDLRGNFLTTGDFVIGLFWRDICPAFFVNLQR